MTPTFSVLMPAYNSEATIAESLDSLLAQTRSDWEAIVVDDGSTDRTADIVRGYADRDPRFIVLSKPNGGTGSARNVAAAHASGELWCLLDADDRYLPEYLEHMARFIGEHPGYDIYSSDGFVCVDGGSPQPDDLQPDSATRSYTAEDLLLRNRIRELATFRRGVFDLVGGFGEDRRMTMEDYDFWLRALLAGARHVHNPERLWVYRLGPGQKTSDALSATRSDQLMLTRLIDCGALSGNRLRLARSSKRGLDRAVVVLEALRARQDLEHRLREGDYRGARVAYLSLWRGYDNKTKYLAGLLIIAFSPRSFARMSSRWAVRTPGADL